MFWRMEVILSTYGAKYKDHAIKLLPHLKWWKLSPAELKALASFGFISKVGVFLSEMGYTNTPPAVVKQLDYSKIVQIESPSLTIKQIIAAGGTHADMWPYLTKKERHNLYVSNEDTEVGHLISVVNVLGKVRYDIPDNIAVHLNENPNVESHPIIVDWVMNHLDRFNRSREVHGPAGSTRIIYYRELIRYIRPEDITNGVKTSWKKVMSSINDEARKRALAEMGENVSLKRLHVPNFIAKNKVHQITTSDGLIKEGRLMNHCVASYVEPCVTGESYIFHIGDEAPKGATAEVCFKNGEYVLQQIFGVDDSAANEEDVKVARALVYALNANK